jgi:hypothetical protein
LMPLHLGHHAARLGPALRLVAEAGVEHLRLLWRAADGPGQQVSDPLLQDRVGGEPDGVADVLRLEQFVDLGLGEAGITTEVEVEAALAVAGDDRLEYRAPTVGAVDVARP